MTHVTPTVPSEGEEANASDVSIPVQQIADVVNGDLDDSNINYVSGSKIVDGTIVTSKLADTAVTTAKITDANITTAKIADDAVTDNKLDYPRWWQELARTTLSVAGDTITVNSIPARKYLKVILLVLSPGQNIGVRITFNNVTTTQYSFRKSDNGGADTTTASSAYLEPTSAATLYSVFAEIKIHNFATYEKLLYGDIVMSTATGSGAAPQVKQEFTGRWANTSDQITRIDVTNPGTGDFAIGSEVIVLGHD